MNGSLHRSIGAPVVLLIALALTRFGAGAQGQGGASEDLRALFPRVASVDTGGTYGLVRAPLPAEVLESVRADLADVRVFVDGQSVEFVIEADPPRQPAVMRTLTPLDVREQNTGDRAQPTVVETWDVELPPDPPVPVEGQTIDWRLHFGFAPADLVRELSVHRVDPDGTETPVLNTTLFRLASPLREKVEVRIPPVPGARLRLRLTGPAPALRPVMTLHSASVSAAARDLSVPLEVVGTERSADAQETIVTLRRPRGIVPDALVFETTSGAFHREVIVEDAGVGGRRSVAGRGVLYNIPSWNEASLEVALGRTTGDLLRVRVLDQDAPPLTALRVEARVRQPALVFEAYGSNTQLYFGGARAARPAYGLRELRGSLTPSARVEPATVQAATDNRHFHAGPVLEFAMRPGAPLELAGFSHVRSLRVGDTPEGLVRVQPDVETMALTQDHGADLRIADTQGRQWPYLWGDEWLDRSVEVAVNARPMPADRTTAFYVVLPAGHPEVDHLLLDIPETLVSRAYQVWGADSADEELREIARGTLERSPSVRGQRLQVAVGQQVSALEVRVQDGDEQPLTVRGATLVTKGRDLFMAAPAGEYRLLVGNPRIYAPTYDVESPLDLLLSLSAVDATLGPLGDNPDYAPPSPSRDALTETALLVVLGVAVLLLGVLTFRLVRDEPEPSPASGADPSRATDGPTDSNASTDEAADEPAQQATGETAAAHEHGGDAQPPPEDGETAGASPAERDKMPDDR